MTSKGAAPEELPRPEGTARWRILLLAVIALGASGLMVELLLLEHWLVAPQFAPLLTLTLILASAAAVGFRPNPRTLRAFRAMMAWAVVAGLLGIGFHLRDNLAFEREIAPDASVVSVVWNALRGATPLLAPGSLVQLGLVGLVFTYGHPRLHTSHETETS